MKPTRKKEKKIKKRQEPLTPAEIKAIRLANLGYGNFVANAKRAGVYLNTYRSIIDRGYGTIDHVQKIRKTILYESSSHQPEAIPWRAEGPYYTG